MMSSTTVNLVSSGCLLEFMTVALEFMWSDELVGSRLLATENRCVFRDLDVDSECIESVSG